MKQITKTIGYFSAACIMVVGLFSCTGNNSDSYTRCEDSLAMYTKPVVAKDTAVSATNTADTSANAANESGSSSSSEPGKSKGRGNEHITMRDHAAMEMANEPTGPGKLVVTSTAFANMGVIPVKYTCDGQGATPPLKVTNIPPGSQSLAIIVYDYNATPEGGETFWIIWNLDTYGNIPEDFHNSHETMNAAHQYGNTPLCAKSGNHKYHFIVYALDTRLVIGKNTTKASIEKVMRGHVLGKGEIVGIYNKQLE